MATLKQVIDNISSNKQEINYNNFNFIIFKRIDNDKVERIHIIQKETKLEIFFFATPKMDTKSLEDILKSQIINIKALAGTKFTTLINNGKEKEISELLKILFK